MPAKIFLSHSAKDDLARAVLDGLHDALSAANHDVLLDKARLQPGDAWRAKLHRWLGECHGAVLLFSNDALGSDWVWSESNILCWRYAREHSRGFQVVPVLLDGLSPRDERLARLRPVQLPELQFASASADLDPTADRAAYVQDLVDQIVPRFVGIVDTLEDRRLREWIEDVADVLQTASARHRERAAGSLRIDASDLALYAADPEVLLAHQLVHSKLPAVADALAEMRRSLRDPNDRECLRDLLRPVWVPVESARDVAVVAESTEVRGRNLSLPDTLAEDGRAQPTPGSAGRDYVSRAYCCDNDLRVVEVGDEHGEADLEFELALHRAFLDECGFTSDEIQRHLRKPQGELHAWLRAEIAARVERRNWFVLFGPNAVARDLPGRMRTLYAGMTFVLLGPPPESGQLGSVVEVAPPLTARERTEVQRATTELNRFVTR